MLHFGFSFFECKKKIIIIITIIFDFCKIFQKIISPFIVFISRQELFHYPCYQTFFLFAYQLYIIFISSNKFTTSYICSRAKRLRVNISIILSSCIFFCTDKSIKCWNEQWYRISTIAWFHFASESYRSHSGTWSLWRGTWKW